MEKIKVCAYCRVSTNSKDQANSYENQKDYFEKELSKNPDYELIHVYADRGLSGTKLSRPEFDKMLKDAGLDIVEVRNNDKDNRREKIKYVTIPSTSRKPKFNKIFVTNTSRFARNVLVEEILRDLRKNEVYVHFLDLGKTTENEDDITYIQIFQSFDERESRDKSKKVSFGIAQGVDKGVIHSSSKLYGYKYLKDENRLEIIPEEAEVVKKVFELYFEEGYGFRRIVDYLTANNIFTRQDKPFAKSTIRRILDNEKYIGLNNRCKHDTGKVFEKNSYPKIRDEYITTETDKIPAIIEEELFYKCREILHGKVNYENQKGIYRGTSEYAGKIFCDKCGSVYHSNVDNGNHFFNCSLKKKKGRTACDNINIKKEQIDELLETWQKGYFGELIQGENEFVVNKLTAVIYNLLEKLDADNTEQLNFQKNKLSQLEDKHSGYIELFTSEKIRMKDKIIENIQKIELEIETTRENIKQLSKNNYDILINVNSILEKVSEFKKINIKKEYSKAELLEEINKMIIKERDSKPNICFDLKIMGFLGDWLSVIYDKGIDTNNMKFYFTQEEIEILQKKYFSTCCELEIDTKDIILSILPFISKRS